MKAKLNGVCEICEGEILPGDAIQPTYLVDGTKRYCHTKCVKRLRRACVGLGSHMACGGTFDDWKGWAALAGGEKV